MINLETYESLVNKFVSGANQIGAGKSAITTTLSAIANVLQTAQSFGVEIPVTQAASTTSSAYYIFGLNKFAFVLGTSTYADTGDSGEFTIQFSLDGTTWTSGYNLVYVRSGNSPNFVWTATITGTYPQSAKYVRFVTAANITMTGGKFYASR